MLTIPIYTENFSRNSILKSLKYHAKSTVYEDILSYFTSTCLCECDITSTDNILQFYLGTNDDNSKIRSAPGRGTLWRRHYIEMHSDLLALS